MQSLAAGRAHGSTHCDCGMYSHQLPRALHLSQREGPGPARERGRLSSCAFILTLHHNTTPLSYHPFFHLPSCTITPATRFDPLRLNNCSKRLAKRVCVLRRYSVEPFISNIHPITDFTSSSDSISCSKYISQITHPNTLSKSEHTDATSIERPSEGSSTVNTGKLSDATKQASKAS